MEGFENARRLFEDVAVDEGDIDARKRRTKTKYQRCWKGLIAFMKSSRFAGIPLFIIFGAYVYYLVAFLIMDEPIKNVAYREMLNSSKPTNVPVSLDSLNAIDCDNLDLSLKKKDSNSSSGINVTLPYWEIDNHHVGLISGGIVTFTLGTASLLSAEVRCTMMLIIPGLFAGRGRAFVLTAGMGLLIDGPIDSINSNLEEIVNSMTCMYKHMKSLACRFKTTYANIFEQVKKILTIVQDNMKARLAEIEEKITHLTGDAKREFIALKEKLEKDIEDYKNAIGSLSDVLSAPGNFLNAACSGVSSALSSAGNWIADAGKEVGGFFSDLFGRKRRKRDNGCGIPPVVPDVDINVPGLDLSKLKEFAKNIMPDVDFLDMNLDDFSDALQAQSISSIRLELISILKVVFESLQEKFFYIKRIFYLVSLIFIFADAYRYMIQYHSDNSFDNMYVDSTLKKLWKRKHKDETIALRHWELNERYQVTNSGKVTKKEAKRIFLLSIPTILFGLTAGCVIVADSTLAGFLDILKNKGSYGISFQGMEQGIHLGSLLAGVQNGQTALVSLQIEAFDLSTDPCLPIAKKTEMRKLCWLIAIVVICAVSCVADAYAARWRSEICNLFHEEKARERAQYLMDKIVAGRGNRRYQLRIIATREKLRRDKLAVISLFYKSSLCLSRLMRRDNPSVNCHGCDWNVPERETREHTFRVNGNDVATILCTDCLQDI